VVAALMSPSNAMTLDGELRLHAASCAACSDVVTLVAILRAQRDDALRDVRVPAAGQVWWRAAVRAHAERAHAARRPIVWAQGIACVCAMTIAMAAISFVWPSMLDAATWMARGVSVELSDFAGIGPVLQPIVLITLAVIACLVLTPLVVYFALSDE
jgi:hypothetical protein